MVNPDPITATITVIQNPTLIQFNDGILHGVATGGYIPLIYTLLWSDGQNTEDAANLTPGSYTLTVTDSHGCTGSASTELLVGAPVLRSASMSNRDNNISIYPNPFSEIFNINYSGEEPFNVLITDYSGRLVKSYRELTKHVVLGKDLAPGIYMVKIETDKGLLQSGRLIKIK